MENFAVALVCIALLIIGAVAISMSALNAINTVSDALRAEEIVSRDIRETSISCVGSSMTGSGSIAFIDIDNKGNTDLMDYKAWDVIVRYEDGDTLWIPYGTTVPGWATGGFFFPGPWRDLRA